MESIINICQQKSGLTLQDYFGLLSTAIINIFHYNVCNKLHDFDETCILL